MWQQVLCRNGLTDHDAIWDPTLEGSWNLALGGRIQILYGEELELLQLRGT